MEEETQQSSVSTPATPPSKSNPYAVPAAILVGFGMIAGAVYFSGQAPVAVPTKDTPATAEVETQPIPDINETDHVLGNPNAPIVIIEYSDFDCPFCKDFHKTMNSVIDAYGQDGKVAWVYRHFPIASLHPSASHIAEASECVAELGGNDAFWTFANLIFNERETNELTDTTRLPEFAATAGIESGAFNECLESGRNKALVDADLTDGVNAGVRGTPYSFILIAGQQLPVNGAQPLEFMTANLNNLLEQLEKAEAPQ